MSISLDRNTLERCVVVAHETKAKYLQVTCVLQQEKQALLSSGYLCPLTEKQALQHYLWESEAISNWCNSCAFSFLGPCRILCLFMFLVPLIYLVCVCQIVMQLILLSVVRPWNALRSWYLITRLFEDVAPNELIFIWVWVTIPKFWLSIQGSVIFSF